jgi:hypothetical protein
MKLIPKQENRGMVGQTAPELEQEIRCRAYELYEERGRTDGHDMQDWLEAESEITSSKPKAVAA